jgi:hypothetical protein
MTSNGDADVTPISPVSSLQRMGIYSRPGLLPAFTAEGRARNRDFGTLHESSHPCWAYILVIYRRLSRYRCSVGYNISTLPSRTEIFLTRSGYRITCCLKTVFRKLTNYHMSLRNVMSRNSDMSRIITVHTIPLFPPTIQKQALVFNLCYCTRLFPCPVCD